MKWTETILDLESSIFNTAWRWIWMENVTATLCQWLYRANAGLQQMMQSYRAFALRVHLHHWECMENSMDLAGSDGPWLWCRELHDHQLYPKDADEMSPDSRKYCMRQYVRLESIQNSKTEFLIFSDRFKIFKSLPIFSEFDGTI